MTEAERQEDGDYRCFGLVTNGSIKELGYFMLNELANASHPKFRGMAAVERDCYFDSDKVGEFMDAE